jgi:cytochrome o ubiquinol oxidase subunit 2
MSRLARCLIGPASRCAVLSVLVAGCQPGVLDPAGPVGTAERQILINSLGIMLAIVVPTIVATLVFAWWFRAGNTRAKYRPGWGFSGQLELVVWSIPLMTIMLLGGVAWLGSHDLDPYKPLPSDQPQLEVQVVSLDWKWLFIYPEQGIATVNELVIPAGRPVHFSLTSASVMNTFFVPQLGSMIYTMGGMTSQVHLQADQPGTYRGQSGHYSGDGFSDMHFEVQSKPAAAFEQWVAGVRTAGKTLDDDGYKELSKQTINVTPYTYGGVADGLFNRIVTLQLPLGPGPAPDAHPSGTHGPQQAEK